MEVLLKQVGRYLHLSEDIENDIRSKFKVKHYLKRETVFHASEICEDYYFVAKGLLRLFTKVNDIMVTTEYVEEGNLSTIYHSVLSNTPSKESIFAEQDSEVWTISKKDLEGLKIKYPEFSNFLIHMYEEKCFAFKKRELDLTALSSEEIYLKFVKENRSLYSQIKGKDLSTYLNMTQETASRIKKKNKISKYG